MDYMSTQNYIPELPLPTTPCSTCRLSQDKVPIGFSSAEITNCERNVIVPAHFSVQSQGLNVEEKTNKFIRDYLHYGLKIPYEDSHPGVKVLEKSVSGGVDACDLDKFFKNGSYRLEEYYKYNHHSIMNRCKSAASYNDQPKQIGSFLSIKDYKMLTERLSTNVNGSNDIKYYSIVSAPINYDSVVTFNCIGKVAYEVLLSNGLIHELESYQGKELSFRQYMSSINSFMSKHEHLYSDDHDPKLKKGCTYTIN